MKLIVNPESSKFFPLFTVSLKNADLYCPETDVLDGMSTWLAGLSKPQENCQIQTMGFCHFKSHTMTRTSFNFAFWRVKVWVLGCNDMDWNLKTILLFLYVWSLIKLKK